MATTLSFTEISDFEAHHLPKSTWFEEFSRNVFSVVSKFVCGLDENLVPDMDAEEKFEESVSQLRVTPLVLGGGEDLATEYKRLSECRVVEACRARRVPLPDSLAEYRDVVSVRQDAIVVGEVECPIGEGEGSVVFAQPSVSQLRDVSLSYAPAKLQSTTVAAVLVAIDAKLGIALEHTEANVLVVERQARKVMKDANFRAIDISRHLPQVTECYFMCRQGFELAGAKRRRAPRWLLWLLGYRRDTTARKA